ALPTNFRWGRKLFHREDYQLLFRSYVQANGQRPLFPILPWTGSMQSGEFYWHNFRTHTRHHLFQTEKARSDSLNHWPPPLPFSLYSREKLYHDDEQNL